jgi:plasmid rolling circle replication initiator protein Rep
MDTNANSEGCASLLDTKETTARLFEVKNGSEFGEKLTETPAKHAQTWTDKKADGQYLGRLLRSAANGVYGEEVARCATQLALEKSGDETRARPFATCKRRWCPVCEWRKSRKRLGAAITNLPNLVDLKKVRFRFLTLTVKNVKPEDLAATVGEMLKAFRRLTHADTKITGDWLGFIRALEITAAPDGTFHPHLHILHCVLKSSKPWPTTDWVAAWRKAARLDYDPICDIRAVKDGARGLAEVMKYTTKPAKIAGDAVGLAVAVAALKGRRLQQAGGVLSSIFEEGGEEGEAKNWGVAGVFWWRANEQQYRRKIQS